FYSVFRHGTVHKYQPKRFFINEKSCGYVISKMDTCFLWKADGFDECIFTHLELKSPKPGIQILPISLPIFRDDLKSAVNDYINDLMTEEPLLENAYQMKKYVEAPIKFVCDKGKIDEIYQNPRNEKKTSHYKDCSELLKF